MKIDQMVKILQKANFMLEEIAVEEKNGSDKPFMHFSKVYEFHPKTIRIELCLFNSYLIIHNDFTSYEFILSDIESFLMVNYGSNQLYIEIKTGNNHVKTIHLY